MNRLSSSSAFAILACLLLVPVASPAVAKETVAKAAIAKPTAATIDSSTSEKPEAGWVSLFNGRDLTGWKALESPDTFRVQDGILIAHGPRSHLFYVGKVGGADFKNFEWKCEILTKPNANSGMHFHTKQQKEGWLAQGHEVQINQSHADPRRTGGLYGVRDVMKNSPVKDDQWFTQHVLVKNKHVVVKVNGKVTCDYTEPDDYQAPKDRPGRKLSHGTIAIQGHDERSETHFRNVRIKLLD